MFEFDLKILLYKGVILGCCWTKLIHIIMLSIVCYLLFAFFLYSLMKNNLTFNFMLLHRKLCSKEKWLKRMAIATVVTVAEILKNNGLAVEKKDINS